MTMPYLYGSAQSDYSLSDPSKHDFDPKAFTRASWQPAPARPKPTGPLVNVNRHPDSYLMVPYGNTNAKELPANTAKKVKIVRGTQLGFRILQTIGAIGLLFCVIALKISDGIPSYVTRIAPAVDILTSGYAIYHLCRSAKSRPPASSAAYHIFALTLDVALIPFYIYMGMLAKWEYTLPTNSAYNQTQWTSFFNDPTKSSQVIYTMYLAAIVVGCIHLVTAVVSFYLMYIFRKISHLPPDMNPLENNLTSRRSMKHRYKNSELSLSKDTLVDSTLDLPDAGGKLASATTRPISFAHTRTNSEMAYSPHNPSTAAASRSNLDIPHIPAIYQQPRSAISSNLSGNRGMVETRSSTPKAYSHGFMSEPSSREPTMSATLTKKTSSIYSDITTRPGSVPIPPVPRKSSKRDSSGILSENWLVHEDQDADFNGDLGARSHGSNPAISIIEEDTTEYSPYRSDTAMPPANLSRGFTFSDLRNPLSAPAHTYRSVPQSGSPRAKSSPNRYDDFALDPLGMNPPTPELAELRRAGPAPHRNTQPLGATSGNIATTPKKSVGTPTKTRFYGDLNAAMAGVRGSTPSPSPSPSPPKHRSAHRGGVPERHDWAEKESDGGHKGRIVSRTGIDDGVDRLSSGSWLRGRNVSGKAAEEGVAGVGWRSWGR